MIPLSLHKKTMLLCPRQDAYHILAGAMYLERGFFFFLYRQGGSLRLARSSLPSDDNCSLNVALRIALSARLRGVRHAMMRANVHHSPVARAARSVPMTSLALGPCAVCRVVPGTHSARLAHTSRAAEHVELRTRAHMGTRSFQIHPTLAYILSVHEVVLSQTRNISGLDSLHADVHAMAARKTWDGPRTLRPAWRESSPEMFRVWDKTTSWTDKM